MKRITLLFLAMFMSAVAMAAEPPSPEAVVEATAERVFTVLRENRARLKDEPKILYALVDEVILPLVDFEAMARLVLGPNWRTATPDQRSRFVKSFREMLVRTYTTQLVDYADKRVVVQPGRRPAGETTAIVYSEVLIGEGRPNLPVSYSMRFVDGRWRVYDLTIEGLSFVKNFRTSFDTEIREKGLDALIVRLAQSKADEWRKP